jgi:hypothetical protein
MNIIQPQFSSSDVVYATGMPAATLQAWASREIITPASEETGQSQGFGARRLYSAENVVHIGLIRALVEMALTPTEALNMCPEMIAQEIRRTGKFPFYALIWIALPNQMYPQLQDYRVLKAGYVLANGETECELHELMPKLLESGKPSIVLPTRKIEETVMGRLQEILGNRGTE